MSHVVRYRVREAHRADTVKGETVLHGSVHHAELDEFTGLVTRSHDDGTHDIVFFPPDRAPVHVARVAAGDGPGEIRLADDLELGARRRRRHVPGPDHEGTPTESPAS